MLVRAVAITMFLVTIGAVLAALRTAEDALLRARSNHLTPEPMHLGLQRVEIGPRDLDHVSSICAHGHLRYLILRSSVGNPTNDAPTALGCSGLVQSVVGSTAERRSPSRRVAKICVHAAHKRSRAPAAVVAIRALTCGN